MVYYFKRTLQTRHMRKKRWQTPQIQSKWCSRHVLFVMASVLLCCCHLDATQLALRAMQGLPVGIVNPFSRALIYVKTDDDDDSDDDGLTFPQCGEI